MAAHCPFWRVSREWGTEAILALGGWGAIPARLLAEGFELEHGDVRATIHDLFRQPRGLTTAAGETPRRNRS